ncbi:Ribosome biogenesis GTPase A [Urinicoccus massiliensis]|uniref:Ribosome biogenesis GTPase A n=1 Tax=Urinicoccus massiliensis TaxID=1723382 RepID=A0A8H2M5C2_9FIRM|nr:ribosome biogenesis GTPase YlqF [Urinicoccus massiliensis]KGF10873.1 GTPase [Tissierellia bacterium S5-A11]VFB16411.1 Ribosome biogenesis GTPase A [Urinicoccus massiliensis]
MNINWFPGHMKKTMDDLSTKANMIDFMIEMLDARIPFSSQNPKLSDLLPDKNRLVLINKSDLADPKMNQDWLDRLNGERNTRAILYNSKDSKMKQLLKQEAYKLNQDLLEKKEKRGLKNHSLRAMVIGIPNVGKSTFINSYIGKKSARIGNRPGITKTNQWIRLGDGIDLLDTPGVLWPKFESERVAKHLAYVGSIKDELLDLETLSLHFIQEILNLDPKILEGRYGVRTDQAPLEILDEIGEKRGAIMKGGYVDYEKVSNLLFDDFRKGRLGRITLEDAHEWL